MPNFFCTLLKKKTKHSFSSKVNQKNLATKKTKQKHLNRWRIAQLLMLGFWMRVFHYCLKKNEKCNKQERRRKKNLKHHTTHKASRVTPIWKPLGQGRSGDIVCFQMIKVTKLVLNWYWHFTLYQCNSHFKLHTDNYALNNRQILGRTSQKCIRLNIGNAPDWAHFHLVFTR